LKSRCFGYHAAYSAVDDVCELAVAVLPCETSGDLVATGY
jgi:hypothetical protein